MCYVVYYIMYNTVINAKLANLSERLLKTVFFKDKKIIRHHDE